VSYLIALVMILFVTLYPLPANMNPMKWSRLHNSLFIALSRPAFLMALMLIMTNMWLGHFALLKSFFGANFWVPLARLSYLVYLVFPIVTASLISSMSMSLFLDYYTMFYLLTFAMLGNYVFAFFSHLVTEGPLSALVMHLTNFRPYTEDKQALKSGKLVEAAISPAYTPVHEN